MTTEIELPEHQATAAMKLLRTLEAKEEFTFHRYGSDDPTWCTATFELQEPNEGLKVVATLQGQNNDIFLTPTDGDSDQIGRFLINLEGYGVLHTLGLGHTIPLESDDAAARGWVAMVLMAPGDLFEGFESLEVNGRRGEVYWVLFIDAAEHALKRERGFEAFLEALSNRDLFTW